MSRFEENEYFVVVFFYFTSVQVFNLYVEIKCFLSICGSFTLDLELVQVFVKVLLTIVGVFPNRDHAKEKGGNRVIMPPRVVSLVKWCRLAWKVHFIAIIRIVCRKHAIVTIDTVVKQSVICPNISQLWLLC